MKYQTQSYELYELGDEIHPGFHVGDRISRPAGRHPEEGWVSNIKTFHGYLDRAFVITVNDDPNKVLAGRGQADHLCHGDWVMMDEVDDVTIIECTHITPVTDEEVAELFGMTLLEMIPEDDSTR